MKLLLAALLAATCSVHCTAQTEGLQSVFQSDSDQFLRQPTKYETIWAREGPRITAAMEAASGVVSRRNVRAKLADDSSI